MGWTRDTHRTCDVRRQTLQQYPKFATGQRPVIGDGPERPLADLDRHLDRALQGGVLAGQQAGQLGNIKESSAPPRNRTLIRYNRQAWSVLQAHSITLIAIALGNRRHAGAQEHKFGIAGVFFGPRLHLRGTVAHRPDNL